MANIRGTSASDTLRGTTGDDHIDGLGGLDIVDYSAATGAILVQLGITTGQGIAGQGTDTLASIEGVIGSAFDDDLIGSDAKNLLDGARGNDSMSGEAGNDTYRVDSAGDHVVESAGNGTDLVLSTALAWTLGDNVENARIVTTAHADLAGNALDNVIAGGAGSNSIAGGAGKDTLSGKGGADSIEGGRGADVLSGGAGNDVFVYQRARDGSGDTIKDFLHGHDHGDLHHVDANIAVAGNQDFTFVDAFGADATGQLRFEYDAARDVGLLIGSTDADAHAEIVIMLAGVQSLVAADVAL